MSDIQTPKNKRQIKSILFADVAGYTRLMQDDEEATYSGITELVELFRKGCEEFDGEVLELRGDGIFALFNSAINSVLFADKTQDLVEEFNTKYEDHRKILFRIGIHIGDVIQDAQRHYGDSVNIAARIERLADAGGICISDSVYQQIKNKGRFGYQNIGPQMLKNIKEPVEVYHVTKDTNTAMRVASKRQAIIEMPFTTKSDDLSVRPSIAVLPFKNTNNNPDFEYFSDGITEDIITNLSKFHNLFVISRSSSFTYKGKSLPTKQISQELGVRYIADGSVRTAGNRVRISIQLVDSNTDKTLWTEHYDRSLDDIFEIQDEVSAIICNATSVKISKEENARMNRLLPNNLEAYDNVLKGQQRIFRYTKEDMKQARKLYEAAAKLDPRYGRALASIAKTLNLEWLFSWTDASEDTLEHALSIAKDAVFLDEGDARGHAGVGFVSLYQKRHDTSINAYKRALQLNPNDADVISELAETYSHTGQSEESIELFKKAMHLNPFYPDDYLWCMAGAYYNLKRYQEAIDIVEQMNNPTEGGRILAASYAQLGEFDKAREYSEKILSAHPDFSIDTWVKIMLDKFEVETMHFAEGLRKAGLT